MSGPGAPEAEAFDRRYRADPDPWRYDTSDYERAKYEHTLASLPDGPTADALELGCSNGAFTGLLAERCARVLAVDFSAEAVRLARLRTAGLSGVSVEHRDLRRGLPTGTFDLVLASEVLYYWERADVLAFCDSALGSLSPAGSLLVVNWRGDDPDAPLDGDSVHELLTERLEGELDHAVSEPRPGYVLDRWDRRTAIKPLRP